MGETAMADAIEIERLHWLSEFDAYGEESFEKLLKLKEDMHLSDEKLLELSATARAGCRAKLLVDPYLPHVTKAITTGVIRGGLTLLAVATGIALLFVRFL